MQHWFSVHGWRRSALFALGALVGLGGLVAFLSGWFAPFRQAQSAWAARPFGAYQAEIVHHYTVGELVPLIHECTMQVAVAADGQATLLGGDCPEALSLDAILARFAPFAAAPVAMRRCGYGGCVCLVSALQVTRDPATGYPQALAREWQVASRPSALLTKARAHAPAALRATVRDLLEGQSPCQAPQAEALADSPITSERFEIVALWPLAEVTSARHVRQEEP